MNWKAFWKKLVFPPIWLMALLLVVSAAALPFVFIKGLDETPVAYIVYVIAFYTVCVVSVFCGVVLPKQYKSIREKLYAIPIAHRYMTDAAFKTHMKLYAALAATLLSLQR